MACSQSLVSDSMVLDISKTDSRHTFFQPRWAMRTSMARAHFRASIRLLLVSLLSGWVLVKVWSGSWYCCSPLSIGMPLPPRIFPAPNIDVQCASCDCHRITRVLRANLVPFCGTVLLFALPFLSAKPLNNGSKILVVLELRARGRQRTRFFILESCTCFQKFSDCFRLGARRLGPLGLQTVNYMHHLFHRRPICINPLSHTGYHAIRI